jgi:hypothetical protein
MLAKTPLKDQMIAWLEQQDPNERYDWSNECNCACAQFARATDRMEEWSAWMRMRMPVKFTESWGMINSLARPPELVSLPYNDSFGNLLQRMREHVE